MLIEDMQHEQYCFYFDKTTTSQIKKQYDGYITYFSKKYNQVVCEYAGSWFVSHCPVEALLEYFYHFIGDLNLSLDNLLNLGMDGPNVNKNLNGSLWRKWKETTTIHLSLVVVANYTQPTIVLVKV